MILAKRVLVLAALAVLFATGCSPERANKKDRPSSATRAAAETTKLKIGDPAPDFTGIVGTDDQKHSLADYKDARLVVLVFTCNHCPVANAYQDRLMAIDKEYRPKGVQVVAINVNNIPEDRLDPMKERAKQKGYNFPYLYDATQKTGRDYSAKVTPHVFVLDRERKIAYMGAVDDDQQIQDVKKPYLRNALDALLAGKKPSEEATQQFGCSIKYE
jgi:peroxiredoxin